MTKLSFCKVKSYVFVRRKSMMFGILTLNPRFWPKSKITLRPVEKVSHQNPPTCLFMYVYTLFVPFTWNLLWAIQVKLHNKCNNINNINNHTSCLELFWTVFTCKWCVISAYFSPDSDKMTFLLEKAILLIEDLFFKPEWFCSNNLKWKITNTLFTSHDISWWTWVFISCFNSHSDGTHSLQRILWWASDVMKKQTLSLERPKGDYIFSKFSFLGELFL